MLLDALNRAKLRTVIPCVLLVLVVSQTALPQEKGEAIDLYYSANALYNRKLYRLACEEYLSFLQEHPGHDKAPQATFGLALCHYSLGNFKKAAPLLEALGGKGRLENQQEIHNLHGQCLLSLDRPEEAETAFAWSTARGHGKDAACTERGLAGVIEARYRQSKWKGVVADSGRFLKSYPASNQKTRVIFQGAVARFELGLFAEARTQLSALFDRKKKTPFMQHVTFLLAESHRELGATQEAARLYDLAARKMSGAFTAEALYRLGVVRFREGNYSSATRDFLELTETGGASPKAGRARIYLGRCYLESGALGPAEKVFLSFPEKDPLRIEARLWLARTWVAGKKTARAKRCLDETLRTKGASKSPFHADLLYELARTRMETGDFEKAAGGFAAAAKLFGGKKTSSQKDPSRTALALDSLWLEAYCLHKAGSFEKSYTRCGESLRKHSGTDKSGDLFFLEAENLFMLEKFARAATLFQKFLASYADHFYTATAQFRLAQAYYHTGQWRPALDALEALPSDREKEPFFSQTGYIRGDCCFNLGEWERAIALLGTFAANNPTAANADAAAYKAALALERKGESEKACAALESFPARFPRSSYGANASVELGRLHYEAGRYEAARLAFSRGARKNDNPYALYYLGYVAMAEGERERAIGHFHSFAKRFGGHTLAADALLQQGVLNARIGKYDKARPLLRSFLREHSGHDKSDQALFYLGLTSARQQEWQAAEKHFGSLLASHPASPLCDRALYEWAWCEKGRKRPKEAARLYEELLSSYRSSSLAAEVLFELAEIDYAREEFDLAIARLEKIAGNNPDADLRQRTLYRLGWNRFSAGDMSGAAGDFESMARDFPDSKRKATALYQAGEARLQLREYEDAYGNFKALCGGGAAGDLAEQALLRLGECAALTSRWEEAESVYRTLIDRYPKSRFLNQALFGRGWALQNQNRTLEAIDAYKKVIARGERDETSARSQFQIGECHFAGKNYSDAVKALIKVEVLYSYPGWSSKALLETGRALEIPGNIREARERYRELIDKYPESDAAAVARKRLDDLESL